MITFKDEYAGKRIDELKIKDTFLFQGITPCIKAQFIYEDDEEEEVSTHRIINLSTGMEVHVASNVIVQKVDFEMTMKS